MKHPAFLEYSPHERTVAHTRELLRRVDEKVHSHAGVQLAVEARLPFGEGLVGVNHREQIQIGKRRAAPSRLRGGRPAGMP